jgi:hypothetical protein
MLDKNIIFEMKWLLAKIELNNKTKQGGISYQKPKSDRIDHIHSRTSGIQLGLRAFQSDEILNWMSGLDVDLFEINHSNESLDCDKMPDIGVPYKEFVCHPLSNTVHTALEFINRHRGRRPVMFRNDFWYFKEIISDHIDNMDQIMPNDILIISLPYFEDFKYKADINEILARCCDLNIPVMLDMIWMPLIHDVKRLQNTDCIEVISHSMTKTLPLSGIKGGFCFYRRPVPERYDLYPLGNKIGYHVSLKYLNEKGYWHVRDSMRDLQKKWCGIFDLPKHDMVMIAQIPKGHLLEDQSLHQHRIPESKLFNLIPFYENDHVLCQYLQTKGHLTL